MLNNYGVPPLLLTHGRGSYVWDVDGNKYLDLVAGIAVSTLGHAHPRVIDAITSQAQKLMHTSNLAAHEPGLRLAQKLRDLAGSEYKVFFSQDGATANEAALKLARKWMQHTTPKKSGYVAFENSFHGRTMGALAVTGNAQKRQPFAPFGLDVAFQPYGDVSRVNHALSTSASTVIVETIQGEGGIQVPSDDFLPDLYRSCEAHDSLLIVDEVQSGVGRTGAWFHSRELGLTPHIITLAKGLGGGFPIGAMLVRTDIADTFAPGDHGTTFGGNPMACAAALAVIETIEEQNLLRHVAQTGAWFMQEAHSLGIEDIKEIRGAGLWIGIEFHDAIATAFETQARQAGFIINAVKPDIVRLAPPLNIEISDLKTFVNALNGLVRSSR
jgi:acetylornithine aminotransferase